MPEDSELEVIIIGQQEVLEEEIEVIHKGILREGGWEIEVEEEEMALEMIEELENNYLINKEKELFKINKYFYFFSRYYYY